MGSMQYRSEPRWIPIEELPFFGRKFFMTGHISGNREHMTACTLMVEKNGKPIAEKDWTSVPELRLNGAVLIWKSDWNDFVPTHYWSF